MPRKDLDVIDESLIRVRLAQSRSPWLRKLLGSSVSLRGLADIRLLRAIERKADAGETPSIGDVADSLGIEASTASRGVAVVVDAGLVVKAAAPGDQRRVQLELTETGQSMLTQTTERRREMLRGVLEGWSDEDLTTLAAMLGRLADDFDRATT